MKIRNMLVFASLPLLIGACVENGNRVDVEYNYTLGFFDEYRMNFCVMNEKTGKIDSLLHIEDSISGLYRRTVWSPDGSTFAMTGTIDGVQGTYILNADGSGKRLVLKPKGPSHEGVLDWHDELGLIMVMKNLDGNAEIYGVIDSLNVTNLTNLPSWEFFPAVFPDGRISFFSNVDEMDTEEPSFKQVYTIDPKNLERRLLLEIEGMSLESISKTGIFPDISPDGTLMCFAMDGDIYTIHTNGTSMKNITNSDETIELTPSFSPDGQSVVYSGSSEQMTDSLSGPLNTNLYKIHLTTLQKEQLTHGVGNYFTHPVYRPGEYSTEEE